MFGACFSFNKGTGNSLEGVEDKCIFSCIINMGADPAMIQLNVLHLGKKAGDGRSLLTYPTPKKQLSKRDSGSLLP